MHEQMVFVSFLLIFYIASHKGTFRNNGYGWTLSSPLGKSKFIALIIKLE